MNIVLKKSEEKKHSVIYRIEGEGWSMSVYVPKVLLEQEGNPEEVTLIVGKKKLEGGK